MPHSRAEGDLVYRQTVQHGTGHCYNKAFSSSPYLHVDSTLPGTTLEAQLSLGAGAGGRLAPALWREPVASGVAGRLLQALEGQLAPGGEVGKVEKIWPPMPPLVPPWGDLGCWLLFGLRPKQTT